MGKCVKCGRETKNQYTYYRAYLKERESEIDPFSIGKVVTTSTYTNFVTLHSFVCTKCMRFSITFLICCIMSLSVTVLIIIQMLKGIQEDALVLIAISLFFAAIFLYLFIYSSRTVKNDTRLSDNEVSSWLAIRGRAINKEKDPRIFYFSIEQYKKLILKK